MKLDLLLIGFLLVTGEASFSHLGVVSRGIAYQKDFEDEVDQAKYPEREADHLQSIYHAWMLVDIADLDQEHRDHRGKHINGVANLNFSEKVTTR